MPQFYRKKLLSRCFIYFGEEGSFRPFVGWPQRVSIQANLRKYNKCGFGICPLGFGLFAGIVAGKYNSTNHSVEGACFMYFHVADP